MSATNDKRPQPYDYNTVGEYAEALVEYLVREEFARRDALKDASKEPQR